MKAALTFLACLLATVVLGFAEVKWPALGTCAASDSCCCADPATVDPCICGEHTDSDFQEFAPFVGLQSLGAPPATDLPISEATCLEELNPHWFPALPWHAPPEEKRARLSVWIL